MILGLQTTIPDDDTLYAAFVKKDTMFEGLFFTGVKTTGIFCRPTCAARKPKRENVEFFFSAKAALDQGYRPCRLCHPVEGAGTEPDWLAPFMARVHNEGIERWSDARIRSIGLDPARVRRWFKKNHGLTFQAYLRSLRINRSFGQMQKRTRVIDSAFDSGFESLSGFAEAFKKATGIPPSKSRELGLISLSRITTPLGPMLAGATREGICLLEFADRRMLETQLKRVQARLKAKALPGESPHFRGLQIQLGEYFDGRRSSFSLPLVLAGTEFQQRVWRILMEIPYGQTRSYQEQALALGDERAVRSVARANGDNCIAILIPCHRVIGKNGDLVGYGGGLWRKRSLLDLERAHRA